MPRTSNGWLAEENLKTRIIEPVKGCKFAIADDDRVETLFMYLIQQYHLRVDDITKPHPKDDWSFHFRKNTNNPNEYSTHAGAIAVDLDATEHPNGVATRKTFNTTQVATVQKILGEMSNTITWGGNYNGTPDGMHFNVRPGPNDPVLAAVAYRLAKLVRPTIGGDVKPAKPTPSKPQPVPVPVSNTPKFQALTKAGSKGATVKKVQERLLQRGWKGVGKADGIFGDKTTAVIKAFQAEKGLTVDGIVGKDTWAALWNSPVT